MRYDILIVGDASADLIFAGLPRFPVPGEDTFARDFNLIPGESFTAAVVMHRLGMRVAWAADFGDDLFSQFVLEQARNEGLPDEFFTHHPRPLRRVSASASMTGERGFLTYYDRGPLVPTGLKALSRVDSLNLFIPGLLHGSLFDAAAPLLRQRRFRLFMDGNCPRSLHLSSRSVARAISRVDYFLPNLQEAVSLTGKEELEDCAALLQHYCPNVVVKMGERGAAAYTAEGLFTLPGLPVKAVDTTGAGDCFSAGFISAYLGGKTLRESLAWGNICGGRSTLGLGGTAVHTSPADIHKMMSRFYTDNKTR